MVTMVSRQGRQLQRYTSQGRRRIVGCIPYRLTDRNNHHRTPASDLAGGVATTLRVLVVSSQKGDAILFPKGGWEMDESITEAASREAFEEAGVTGTIEDLLGMWCYKSKSRDVVHEGVMFPLSVSEEAGQWPEMYSRKRIWVTVQEFKQRCPHAWMIEALDRLVVRLSDRTNKHLSQSRL